jgi:4-alpha-glucanotransferase
MSVRTSGILLHPSCLPSGYGIGDLGPSARHFADFLENTGQHLWQVLPLNPTESTHGHSPYHSTSAFAGNPLLISPQDLIRLGMLPESEAPPAESRTDGRIVFSRVIRRKHRLLRQACDRFETRADPADFDRFCRQSAWLDDFCLYTALRNHYHPRPWFQWPAPLCHRAPGALRSAHRKFEGVVRGQKIIQYLFYRQWSDLKCHCRRRGIRIIGDMPLYVPLDSADVWTHPRLFKLAPNGHPTGVSGVPPDCFSATGQLWGHPVYDWDALRETGYAWWIDRIRHYLKLYDVLRIDHFRGLVAFWEVPAGRKTAVGGRWYPVPTRDFFNRLIKRLGILPVIAEDLGTISADVREVLRRYGFPGMRVLLFAFGDDFPDSAFLPHRHEPNCVVYTGTHDNNTVRGWLEEEADSLTRRRLFRYLGREVAAVELSWELIRLAMMSTAATAIIPLQDVIGLGAEGRMNRPAKQRGNWRWRFGWNDLDRGKSARLRQMTETYGRF